MHTVVKTHVESSRNTPGFSSQNSVKKGLSFRKVGRSGMRCEMLAFALTFAKAFVWIWCSV